MVGLIASLESKLRSPVQKGVAGIWLSEQDLVRAARRVKEAGFSRFEAISPYPIHDMDEAVGIPRSYIPWVTFVFGILGGAFGLWFTWWTSAVNWPINVGGKPMFSLAAFIPVIFECVILFAALSSVAAMFIINGIPKIDPPVIDPDLSSHKFAIFVPEGDVGYETSKVEALMKELGASEVKRTEF